MQGSSKDHQWGERLTVSTSAAIVERVQLALEAMKPVAGVGPG